MTGQHIGKLGTLLGKPGRGRWFFFIEGRIGQFVLDAIDTLTNPVHQCFCCADFLRDRLKGRTALGRFAATIRFRCFFGFTALPAISRITCYFPAIIC